MAKEQEQPRTEIGIDAAAAIMDYSESWMAHLRSKKKGPPYHKRGARVFYIKEEVEAYKASITTSYSPLNGGLAPVK